MAAEGEGQEAEQPWTRNSSQAQPGGHIALQADAEARGTDVTLQKGLLGNEGCTFKKEVGDLLESDPPWDGCAL